MAQPLPARWPLKAIGAIARTASGGTPRRGRAGYYGGTIPWVKSGELEDGIVNETIETITELGLKCSSAKVFPEGTLCIALYGATVGKLGILGMDAATNQAVCGIFLPDWMDTRYVFRCLESRRRDLIELRKGGAQPNISQEIIRQTLIPIAPLPEQLRIAAEIDKQFSRLEAGVAALKRVQSNLKRYRAAVLKTACAGRLVPTEVELARQKGIPDSQIETGAQLLERILTERRQSWQSRGHYQEPVSPITADLPPLPKGWTWATFGQLICSMRNGISEKPDGELGLPILRISAVRALSVNIDDTRFLGSEDSHYPDYSLTEGDLLFTRYNGNRDLVGVCGVVPPLTSPLVYPDKLIRCKLIPLGLLPKFVAIMANVGVSRDYLARRVRTTAGQAGISGGDLKVLPIPLAPYAEQTRIVAEVDRRLSVVDEMESLLPASIQRASHLRNCILRRTFFAEPTETIGE